MLHDLPVSSVTLISSRCGKIFTENSRSDFANALSEPLNRTDWESKIFVRASSLSLSTRIRGPPPQVVKVHLKELVCQVEDHSSARCIASLNYPPPEVSTDYAFHTFENTLFLPLVNPRAAQLRVSLTDQNDVPLRLESGGDTILTLEVTDDEMRARGAFTISCTSHHPRKYPGNRLSKFNSPLLSELRLGGKYEVALQSIIFPHMMYESCVAELRIEDEVFRYRLTDIDTTEDFLNQVQLDLVESRWGVELHCEVVNGHVTLSRGRFAMDDNSPEVLALSFSREFYRACGDTGSSSRVISLRPGDSHTFRGRADINIAKPNPVAILESNLVESSSVGDGTLNVLHCVPMMMNRGVGEDKLYVPHKLFFRPVVAQSLEKLFFRFTNPDGEERDLRTRGGDGSRMLITLAFRRRI